MRARSVAILGVVAVLLGGSSERAGAAEANDCPSRCLPQYNEVMCKMVVTTSGERTTVTYYFWSDGVS